MAPGTGDGLADRPCGGMDAQAVSDTGGARYRHPQKQVAGTFTVVIVITVSLLVAAGILYGCNQIHHTLYLVVAIWMSYQMLAACSLRRESMKVCKALEAGDVEQARTAVSMIVGRDTASLTEEGIAKAAVETVAENTSDGVIAPLFYMFLFGPVGAWVYKAINTMDSMLGYKNDKYRYLERVRRVWTMS